MEFWITTIVSVLAIFVPLGVKLFLGKDKNDAKSLFNTSINGNNATVYNDNRSYHQQNNYYD